jgi:hypothetical protein
VDSLVPILVADCLVQTQEVGCLVPTLVVDCSARIQA